MIRLPVLVLFLQVLMLKSSSIITKIERVKKWLFKAHFPFFIIALISSSLVTCRNLKKLYYEIIVHLSPLKSIRLSLVKFFSHADNQGIREEIKII